MEDKIKKIVAKHIKLYRGRGPQYVKINVIDDLISIHVKGVLSSVGELLIKQGVSELPKMAWKEVRKVLLHSLIDELSKEVGKKCSLVLEKTDFDEDTRNIVIKLDS